ncbi:MAG: type IV pilus modification protein PilV [Pedobacter sp.]|nr:type IV pilus modification protein PilV [Pedobacter sp.]
MKEKIGNKHLFLLGKRIQSGVSLLEILIALLITSVGLLGYAGLQSRALLATEDTYQRVQATSIAQEIIDRMRMNGMVAGMQSNAAANPSVAVYTAASNWTGGIPTQNCFNSTCAGPAMALYDIGEIRRMVAAGSNLPSGSAIVATCGAKVCAYVAWGSTTASDCAAANDNNINECVVVQGT